MAMQKGGFQTETPARAESDAKAVLIVDDDEAVSRLMRRVLQAAGYHVTIAPNGGVAVETMTSGDFAVILSDVHMSGMTGVELLGVVRAYDPDVPVILMTGDPTLETAMEAVSRRHRVSAEADHERSAGQVGRARVPPASHGADEARCHEAGR